MLMLIQYRRWDFFFRYLILAVISEVGIKYFITNLTAVSAFLLIKLIIALRNVSILFVIPQRFICYNIRPSSGICCSW